jgi:hypothetical protein
MMSGLSTRTPNMGKQAFPARGKLLQAPALCRKKWREGLAVQSEPARRGESEGERLQALPRG